MPRRSVDQRHDHQHQPDCHRCDATRLGAAAGQRRVAEIAHQHEVCRQRLRGGVPLPLGFLAGTLVGAVAFASVGYLALVAPVIVVGGLTLWASRRPGTMQRPDQP